MRDDLPGAARRSRRRWRTVLDERHCLLLFFLSSSFSSSFSSPVRPCISFLECPVSGAVAVEDGALELLLLEATKSVMKLVVTLVYCFPWSSLCASSAQDINDGDEDVRCCRLNGSLLPLLFVFSSVSLRRNRGTKVCSFLVRLCHFFVLCPSWLFFFSPLSPSVLPFLPPLFRDSFFVSLPSRVLCFLRLYSHRIPPLLGNQSTVIAGAMVAAGS